MSDEVAAEGEREAVPLPIRPSSWAWVRICRVGIIGFGVGLVPVLVLNFGFHLLWPTFLPMASLLIGGAGVITSQIQNFREAEYRYTTLPWRAGELELRDPADGWIVLPGGSGVHFDSWKEARTWSAPAAGTTSSTRSDAPSAS